MNTNPLWIVLAGAGGLALLTYLFAPAEKCSVVPALQIGSSGPRC